MFMLCKQFKENLGIFVLKKDIEYVGLVNRKLEEKIIFRRKENLFI